jgi:hypothetical protein
MYALTEKDDDEILGSFETNADAQACRLRYAKEHYDRPRNWIGLIELVESYEVKEI